MAQQRSEAANPLLREIFALGVYKRSQGRMIRQITFGAIALAVAIGAWCLSEYSINGGLAHMIATSLHAEKSTVDAAAGVDRYVLPGAILMIGLWIGFRGVNYPKFADFLIAVEAEVNKVSWPSKAELVRSTIVVLITIFALAFILFFYDLFWRVLLKLLGVTGV